MDDLVAAGQSRRVRRALPKPPLHVDGRTPLLVPSARALKKRGVQRITGVVGYQHDRIMGALVDDPEQMQQAFRSALAESRLPVVRRPIAGGSFPQHGLPTVAPDRVAGRRPQFLQEEPRG